jgi:hypothetical protein
LIAAAIGLLYSWQVVPVAGVAQLVEQLIRNQQVIGSSPIAGSKNPSKTGDRDPPPAADLQFAPYLPTYLPP